MDAPIGRILDKLDELSLTESTRMVFTSDHGHFYGHHGLIAEIKKEERITEKLRDVAQ